MEAFIKFGQAGGPYQTVSTTEVKKTNNSFRPSRNKLKTPTNYMIKYENRWRRVYVGMVGNSGVNYIIIDGKDVFVDIYENNKAL